MINRFVTVTLLTSVVACSASAQESSEIIDRWITLQLISGPAAPPFKLQDQEPKMRAVYVALAGRPANKADHRRSVDAQNRYSKTRALAIAGYLEKDFDNDGLVTTEEFKRFYKPQSEGPLRAATGLEIEPTPEQSNLIVEQMLAKDMIADSDDNGVIDFAEMRKAASLNAADRARMMMPSSSTDPMLVEALDTSGDKLVSEEEFLVGVRATFAKIDADKNGIVTPEETMPFGRTKRKNTF